MILDSIIIFAEENPEVTVGIVGTLIAMFIATSKKSISKVFGAFLVEIYHFISNFILKTIHIDDIEKFNESFPEWLKENSDRIIWSKENNKIYFRESEEDWFEHEHEIDNPDAVIDYKRYELEPPKVKFSYSLKRVLDNGSLYVLKYMGKIWLIRYKSFYGGYSMRDRNAQGSGMTPTISITGFFVKNYEYERFVQEISDSANGIPEAQAVTAQQTSIRVYNPTSTLDSWYNRMVLDKPHGSIILNESNRKEIFNEIDSFRSKKGKYRFVGAPHRKGILLYGEPGNGKSSIVGLIASKYQMNIYNVPLNHPLMDDQKLIELVQEVRSDSIVLFEDIDSGEFALNRNKKQVKSSGKGITLSGILNVLDGLSSREGIIFIMTTNIVSELDPALIREGRMDVKVYIGNADSTQIEGMFLKFFPPFEEGITKEESDRRIRCAKEFVQIVPEGKQSMAVIQAFLLKNWSDCENAIIEAKRLIEKHGVLLQPLVNFKMKSFMEE